MKGGDGQAADGNNQAVAEERILPPLTGSTLSSPTKFLNEKGRFSDGVVSSVMSFGQGRCARLHKWLSVEGCTWHVLLAVHGNAASVQLVVPICPRAGIRRKDTLAQGPRRTFALELVVHDRLLHAGPAHTKERSLRSSYTVGFGLFLYVLLECCLVRLIHTQSECR